MSLEYPVEKIEQLFIYMENFNKDINEMKQVYDKLNEWDERGLNINLGIESLQEQINSWENTMEILITDFKQNILKLKELDDRIEIDNSTNILEQENMTYIDNWNYLYPIYKKVFTNLENDMEKLTNIDTIITSYQNLGIKLGDATKTIQEQKNNIINGITTSLGELQILIDRIKEESKKVLNEEELTIFSNSNISETNNLAVYSTFGVDANSLLLYFNLNQQINWDATIDGQNILNNVKRALISTHSSIYNEQNGSAHYETGSTNLYQYFYYGLHKTNMKQGRILNETYGASYQDEHGYQRIINIFYDKTVNHVEELVNLFAQNGLTYNPGSQTSEKLYFVLSVDEISDFSQIQFRGE